MRNIIRHYLSEKNDWVACPLNRKFQCDNRCAWFDNVHEQCQLLGHLFDIRAELSRLVYKNDD